MRSHFIETLPYERDSALLLRRLSSLTGLVFIDSGMGKDANARYDILSALPDAVLECAEDKTVLVTGSERTPVAGDYYSALQSLLAEYAPASPLPAPLAVLPFVGGAIGYLAYDNTARIGIYTWAIVVDHHTQRTTLFALENCSGARLRSVQQCLSSTLAEVPVFALQQPFTSNFSQSEYQQAFTRIQDYIHAGDCYQVNLAQRFQTEFSGNPLAAYLTLRQSIHCPFAGYIDTPNGAVLSFSPERFLQVHEQKVLTQPIKGTRPRSDDPEQDRALAQALIDSPKDRAENLMIVDLLRNDLGTLCATGSVKVDKLFELHSFTNVHHLISSISARLEAPHTALDLLRNCFPGGSITGAPKKRAMEIIAELEPDSREVYCGSLFYAGFDGNADSNIMIRTLHCVRDTISCWGGGGIVADSDCAQEYQECFDKINNIIKRL